MNFKVLHVLCFLRHISSQTRHLRAQTGLEYYFNLQPLSVFQVADQVYGLNLNSLQAVLLQSDARQARS